MDEWVEKWLRFDAYSKPLRGTVEDIYAFVQRWIRNKDGPKHFIITGETGCGKSHLASRVARFVKGARITIWENKSRAKIPDYSWIEFAAIADMERQDFKNWLRAQEDVDIIFIEDAGAEVDRFKNGECAERLREIFNEFQRRWIFLTTNIPQEKWAQHWDSRVEDRFHRNSIISDLGKVRPYSVVGTPKERLALNA